MNEAWREPARKRQWPMVLRKLRADLTQYTIYHRINTVPLMRRLPPERIPILGVDIDALGECVEQLSGIHWQLGRLGDFPAVLERLRGNVDDPRWQRKLTYQHAITAHLLDDAAGARRELAKIGPITAAETDVAVLQLHVDLNGEAIPLVEKLALYDRIIDRTHSRSDRFHYAAAKGVELTLAGDAAGAVATVTAAIDAGRASEAEDAFGPDAELWFCRLLEVVGIARPDRPSLVEAAARLRKLLTRTDHFTPVGLGHLDRCLGDALRLSGQWEEAAAAYAASFALDGDPASRIFEATCRLMQDRKNDALAILDGIDFDALGTAERADFAIAFAAVAIAMRDAARLDDAAARLKAVIPLRQYFEHENVKHQLAIERARAAIAQGVPVPRSSRLLDWISSLSRWVMVQPNIAGLGINVNNMVDDAVAARRRGQTGPRRPDE